MIVAQIMHAHATHATIGLWLGAIFVIYYCASTRKTAENKAAAVKEVA